jgi:glycosyltransferase involved in cell wall biosynthesis
MFISPSLFAARMHEQRGLSIPVTHIPMFVPDEFASHDGSSAELESSGPAERPNFLFVGRLEKLKGLQDVIPVFRELDDCDLTVAGSGSYEPELRRLAADLPNVRFAGALSQDRLRHLYRKARALVVPSLCYETFGQVILEAFSTGTPVVARDLGAMAELVRASDGGSLFSSREELSACLRRMIDDPAYRNSCGRSGLRYFRENGRPATHIERYENLIDSLIRDRDTNSSVSPPASRSS